jgi:hypothetical protein
MATVKEKKKELTIKEIMDRPDFIPTLKGKVEGLVLSRTSTIVPVGMKLRAHPLDYLIQRGLMPNSLAFSTFDYSPLIVEFIRVMRKQSTLPRIQRDAIVEIFGYVLGKVHKNYQDEGVL